MNRHDCIRRLHQVNDCLVKEGRLATGREEEALGMAAAMVREAEGLVRSTMEQAPAARTPRRS